MGSIATLMSTKAGSVATPMSTKPTSTNIIKVEFDLIFLGLNRLFSSYMKKR